jgi:hypothetical protein
MERHFPVRTMNCNRDNMSDSSIQRLRDALREFPQGPIKSDAFRIISLLADCWDQLKGGDETSMRGFKLDRAEQLSWDPPLLSFTIERHGATVLGSTRAELQDWTVDLESLTISHTEGRYRQLTPAKPELDVKPIAQRVCDAVQQGPGSGCELVNKGMVVWQSPYRVTIKQGMLIPNDGFKQTIEGRRRRFRDELIERMDAVGWKLQSVGRFMVFCRMR